MNAPTDGLVHNIRPELWGDAIVPANHITPWPGNPRIGDDDLIAASLTEFGQYKPILIQAATRRILVGNNTYRVATSRLGWTHVAVAVLNVDDDVAGRLVAADNRTSDDSTYDDGLLAEFLADLDSLTGTGWTQADYDSLVNPILAPDLLDEHEPPRPAPAAEPPARTVTELEPALPPTPRAVPAHQQMTLSLTYHDDAAPEVKGLMVAARGVLGERLTSEDIVSRALRVLVAVLDMRDSGTPVTMSALATHADLWPAG